MIFSISLAVSCLVVLVSTTAPDVSSGLQSILSNTGGNRLYTYPTDLTRGVIPVSPLHGCPAYVQLADILILRKGFIPTMIIGGTFPSILHSQSAV